MSPRLGLSGTRLADDGTGDFAPLGQIFDPLLGVHAIDFVVLHDDAWEGAKFVALAISSLLWRMGKLKSPFAEQVTYQHS